MKKLKKYRLRAFRFWYFKVRNRDKRDYRARWESYWRTIIQTGVGGQVLWDNVPERAVGLDLPRFVPHMDPTLPILDLGCGNGRQTRFLAQHFPQAIGTDISPSAIKLAQTESAGSNDVVYRVFNAANPLEAAALHQEFGDVNVYMRTVLHIIQKPDRPNFIASIRTLLGEKGTLFQIELGSRAMAYCGKLPGDSPSGLPRLLHNVIRHGAPNVGFNPEEVGLYYPPDRWIIVDRGDAVINTVPLSHGQEAEMPANYLVARPKNNAHR